jgi:hypothetical protein
VLVGLVTLAFPMQTHQFYSISKMLLPLTILHLLTLSLRFVLLKHCCPIMHRPPASDVVAMIGIENSMYHQSFHIDKSYELNI